MNLLEQPILNYL